jgi:hypothetical protein
LQSEGNATVPPKRKPYRPTAKSFELIELDGSAWAAARARIADVPESADELRAARRAIFLTSTARGEGETELPALNDCGNAKAMRLLLGLRNPALSGAARARALADLRDGFPPFVRVDATARFRLRSTSGSGNPLDDIPEDQRGIVRETGEHLETAYERFMRILGVEPTLAPGTSKIDVWLHALREYGLATPPHGPIQLSSQDWLDQPGIRRPTSAHELFHLFQYRFGFRERDPAEEIPWFSEGTATWAEAFVWKTLSKPEKILSAFRSPHIGLFRTGYAAFPFWHFFDNEAGGGGQGIRALLEGYQEGRDAQAALRKSAQGLRAHGSLNALFTAFARSRLDENYWARQGVKGPDDQPIAPRVQVTEVPIPANRVFPETINSFAAHYYRQSNVSGPATLTFHLTVTAGQVGISINRVDAGVTEVFFQQSGPSTVTAQVPISSGTTTNIVAIVVGFDEGGDYSLSLRAS